MESYRWWCALDNHEPRRAEASGTLDMDEYPGDRGPWIVLRDTSDLREPTNAVYLVDDGATVTAWYVAGWNPRDPGVVLNPFPTNPDGRTRPDNGRVIDYSTWSLGPRRAYHLKIRRA